MHTAKSSTERRWPWRIRPRWWVWNWTAWEYWQLMSTYFRWIFHLPRAPRGLDHSPPRPVPAYPAPIPKARWIHARVLCRFDGTWNDRLIGWLIDSLIDWLIDWLILIFEFIHLFIGRLISWLLFRWWSFWSYCSLCVCRQWQIRILSTG